MAELLLKAADYGAALKTVYESCRNTLLPIIIKYRKGILPSKWTYLKMMAKQTYVILLQAGIIQLLRHVIVTFVCPGIGHIIVFIVDMLTQDAQIKAIEKSIHEELDKYEAEYAKCVLVPEHKDVHQHNGIYNKVLKELKLPSDTKPEKALKVILQKKEAIQSDPKQSVWQTLKIYKKEMIVRAYCD